MAEKRGKARRASSAKPESASAGFDVLWEAPARPSRGPKPSLRIADIVKAGVRIADRDGLQALTMRSVARRLRVTTMALYRYVPGKDALVDLIADHSMREVPEPAGQDWRADIVLWARANLAMVRRHPWMLEVIDTRAVAGPNWTRWLDVGLSTLDGLPLSVSEKMAVLLLVDGHVRAGAQLLVGAKGSPDWAQNFSRILAMAPGDERFPALSSLLEEGGFDEPGLDLEAMLDFGLQRLVDGVEALVVARSG